MVQCKNVCIRYKHVDQGRYAYGKGAKRCAVCEIFIDWEGVHCPCCTRKLRTRSHQRDRSMDNVKRIQ